MKRLLGFDPVTKMREVFVSNPEDGGAFAIHTEQDVSDIVGRNKALFNAHDERSRWDGEWHLVGSIPLSEYYALPQEMREDNKNLLKWLSDSDRKHFRTRPGRLV
jgi:hypothetical protein